MKQRFLSLKHALGQGMTEYIIIVALIAVAAIGVYSFFGQTVRHQVASMASELAGDETEANNQLSDAGDRAGDARDRADQTVNLGDYDDPASTQ